MDWARGSELHACEKVSSVSQIQPEPVKLPTVWVGLDELPVQAVNVVACQLSGPGELILNIGHFAPPMFTGTAEEQMAQARAVGFAQVKAVARFSLTPHRAQELITALTTTLEAHKSLGDAQ